MEDLEALSPDLAGLVFARADLEKRSEGIAATRASREEEQLTDGQVLKAQLLGVVVGGGHGSRWW